MSAVTLLVGLLVVAYFGSLFMGGRALRGYGLPSGSEWLILGFVLGPSVFAVVSLDALSVFEPIAGIAMAWLALVLGLEYGFAGARRVRFASLLMSLSCALACAAAIGGSVYLALVRLTTLPHADALRVAAALGLASCETARYAVRWAASRSNLRGPIHDFLEDMADGDELVPLIGLGVLYAFSPQATATVHLTVFHWLGITLAIGVLLGLCCSMLIRGLHHVNETWGVLVGAALLGTGIAWRLGLSPLTATFLMGLCVSHTSRHAPELRVMLARTEPAVLLPTLLLAGALCRWNLQSTFLIVVIAAVLARVASRCLLGLWVGKICDAPKHTRISFAFGFLSTGALTMLVALSFAFRFPGTLGEIVLSSAAVITVMGELVGPLSLSRALRAEAPPELPPDAPPQAVEAAS